MKKKIPYGISDFKDVVSNYYYIDKTKYIHNIEDMGSFLYLIRPRRFGKSLFLNMLDFYYNVKYEKDWKLLKDCYIYKHPTSLKNSFYVIKFDFSAVSTKGDVDENFSKYCNRKIQKFLDTYDFNIKIDTKEPAHSNLDFVLQELKQTNPNIKIYILIDEYDNFINDLLVSNKPLYEKLVSSTEAVYKEFFKLLKALTNENDTLLKKIFFTGVSPLALFDVTSGSNIGINITNKYGVNSMIGVTQKELEDIIKYYGFDELYSKRKDVIKKWYDNYKFNKDIKEPIYNTDMVLYYINEVRISGHEPDELVDINVRTDYRKLKYLVHTNNKLNGNFNVLKRLFTNNHIIVDFIKDSFSAFELTKPENFVSLLYYLGLITIEAEYRGRIKLTIPNQTIRRVVAEFANAMLEDTNTLNLNIQEFSNLIYDLAYDNSLELFEFLANELGKATSVRDLVAQESDIKMFFMIYFSLNRLYATISELELNKGYADIFLLKAPNIKDDIPNILIEFKFFKQSDKVDKKILNEAINKAKEQIIKYRQTAKFSVDRSIIVVFQGFKLIYCDFFGTYVEVEATEAFELIGKVE